MFPTVLFTGVAFSFVGVLQSLGEFNVPALISVVSNLVIILYYLTLDQQFGIYGLAVAFLVGWFLQAAVQVPSLRRLGFRYRPGLEPRSEGMRKVFALMLPVMVSHLGAAHQPDYQLQVRVPTVRGGRSVRHRVFHQLVSGDRRGVRPVRHQCDISQAVPPHRPGAGGEFRETLRTTLHGCLFFVLPMSAGLMVLSRPLISFIYGGGAFDDFSVSITSQGLFWVSLGMTGYAVQNILSRAYFARQKGKVPLAAGAASILVNVLLCMALAQRMGVAGLALSSAVSSTVYAPVAGHPPGAAGGGVLSRSFLLDLGRWRWPPR